MNKGVDIMTFEQILNEITSGLSGDNKRDIEYLQEQCEKYKDSEFSKEIIRACSRLMYELIPDDGKEELERILKNNAKSIEAMIKEIRFNVFEQNIDNALKLSKALVDKVEGAMMFENDTVSEYYTFDNLFEEILYCYHTKPQRAVRRATIPYSEIFFIYGNLLFEKKEYSLAREYLKKALRWNPASCTIAFEYIETFKAEKNFVDFYELTKNQFKYAYTPKDVARCYRNLGFYFVEIKEYTVASLCYTLSMMYDSDNKSAQSELYYIEHTAPEGYEKPTPELLEKYLEEYDLPSGADKDVIGLAYAYGQKAIQDGETEWAVYFLEIVCSLIEDDNLNKLLVQLKNQLSTEEQQ